MARDFISPLKSINAAIAGDNPFDRLAAVRESEIWAPGMADVRTLNQHASDAVFQLLHHTGNLKLQATTITGNSGTGKSHLISRIRHRLQTEQNGLFVYINANHFNDVNLLRTQFLHSLIDSLRRQGSYGTVQSQQLATAIINTALKNLTPTAKAFGPLELLKKLAGYSQSKNQAWINQLTETIFKTRPDIPEPDIVRALVWTLCNAQAPFALKWLAGKMLAPWKADELGLPNHNSPILEPMAWEMVVKILTLMADYYPVVVCFDDIDAGEIGDNSFKRDRIVASLAKRLCDSLQGVSLAHSIAIVTVMSPATWTEKILTLPAGIPNYLSGKREVIQLKEITEAEIIEFVSVTLQEFYRGNFLTPPTPIYPFDSGQLKALAREQITLRQLLEWCAQNFRPAEIDPAEKIKEAFEKALNVDLGQHWEENNLMVGAILFSLQALIGQTINDFKIEEVTQEVRPTSANRGCIQFQVSGTKKGKFVKLGVALMQDEHPQKVAAVLKRLTQYKKFNLTAGCLIRSADKVIPNHWQASHYLQQLTGELGGKWLVLKPEEIRPLLAICVVYQNRHPEKFTQAQIFEFMTAKKLVIDNPLIQEILSFQGIAEAENTAEIISENISEVVERV
ncbi:ATP-binding protein [Ancylothrix sp. C2]|uniref:ATP-binding protein n=1 Tax=Ancylothrix sp. D3o TaxID=2953691 RepID=UPI0021BAD5EC|nr:ATP-binding protein [Ancylothrix sp. D3o]MCT7949275.1 ATP-binding protein [Ancylothrix sp. D3o]